MTSARKQHTQRNEMAHTAARIMIERSIRDYRLAKQKAAEHLGINPRNSVLPKNSEIEAAMAEYQRLFGGREQAIRLLRMREAAAHAMQFFSDFRPRLVGEVLSGTAGAHTPVCLHLFAEQEEAVDMFFEDKGIPFEIAERRFKFADGRTAFYPMFCFVAGEDHFEATVFSLPDLRQPPLSLIDGSTMPRATLTELNELIGSENQSAVQNRAEFK